MLDTAALVALVREKTRAEFAAMVPNLVLLVSNEGAGGSAISFETVAVSTSPELPPPSQRATISVEVVHLVKAPGNPYPERISVGRARNCDVVFRDASISKLHAHFKVIGGDVTKLELVDHGSHNGTKIGGKPVAPNTPTPVRAGDAIVFGRVSARLLDGAALYEMLRALGRAGSALEQRRA